MRSNRHADPFFYVDELAREDGFPALIHSWTVQEVLQWTAAEPPGLVRVERTDAWADDEPPGYVLRSRLGDLIGPGSSGGERHGGHRLTAEGGPRDHRSQLGRRSRGDAPDD